MDESTPTPEPQQPAPAANPAPADQTPPPAAQPTVDPSSIKPVTDTSSDETAKVGPSDESKKVLIVEDDDALAGVYQMRLQAEGFDVRRVANGEEALSAALAYHPDLVLLDIMMPKVSGFDVLDILRNTPETAKLKIIMLTALGQDSDKQRAQALGVDDYLVKSQVVISDVVDRIRQRLAA